METTQNTVSNESYEIVVFHIPKINPVSQVISSQKQTKIGLEEIHQIKLIGEKKKRGHIKGSPSLFWVLKGRQEGKESERDCLQKSVAETPCFVTDSVCKLVLVHNKVG